MLLATAEHTWEMAQALAQAQPQTDNTEAAIEVAFGRGVLDAIEIRFENVSTALLVSCLGLFFVPVTMLSCFGPQCVQFLAARGTKPGAASGVIYGVRLLEALKTMPVETHLVMTRTAEVTLAHETDLKVAAVRKLADVAYKIDDLAAAEQWLESQGIGLDRSPGDIRIDCERCVDCGICTSVCPSGALQSTAPTWQLQFDAQRCLVCEQCIPACPFEAIALVLNPLP
mgnify:CR=1 FL=1